MSKGKKNNSEKEKVLILVKSLDPDEEVSDDADLKTAVEQRAKLYNTILSDYQTFIHDTLQAKKVYKCITYVVVTAILVAITVATIVLFFMYSKFEMVEWLAVVIPLMISFLTVFIVIPQIITNYLFDKDEETHMTDLLKILKEMDYDIRNDFREHK